MAVGRIGIVQQKGTFVEPLLNTSEMQRRVGLHYTVVGYYTLIVLRHRVTSLEAPS